MADKAKHAFGASTNVDQALLDGTIDAYDILFLDGDTDPKVGWIDKNGNKVIVEGEQCVVVVDDENLPAEGETGVIYIFNDEAYIWNGTQFVTVFKSTDLSDLEEEIATKVDAETVSQMIEDAISVEVVEF